MLIVYSDPKAGEQPTVSIRAGDSHRPQLVSQAGLLRGMDLRVVLALCYYI